MRLRAKVFDLALDVSLSLFDLPDRGSYLAQLLIDLRRVCLLWTLADDGLELANLQLELLEQAVRVRAANSA